MDSLVASAARALAAGDPLGALKRIALRDDPPALALRGTAMAQLGDYDRARKLLRRAARGFGARERLAQARCQVAEAEVALAARDLSGPVRALDAAAQALDALGDRANALYARLVGARRQLLVGELEAAEQTLAAVDAAAAPPSLAARAELTRAELALRRVRVADAAAALGRAHAAALAAGIPALVAEIGRARRALSAPSARLIRGGVVRPVRLDEVELRGLLDRQLNGLGPFQDSVDVDRRAMIVVWNVRPVAGQEPLLDICGSVRDGRQPFLTAKSAILLMSTGMVLSG